jgi:molybdopterin converting factor small subunit
MITVNLHAIFAVETGLKTFTLEPVEGSTAGKAILQIVDLYPALRKYWVTEDGGLSGHVLVVLNGKEIYAHPDGLQTIIKSGDRLDFFSPLAGG